VTVPEGNDDALAALVGRARERDPAAEAELHDRLRPFVRRRLEEARARRNWFWLTDLEEATQDVLTSFFAALREGKFAYEGDQRLRGFLVRTAWFTAMNAKDRAARERAVSLFDEEEGGLRFDVAAFAAAAPDDLARRECLELLARAITSLNENRREVVERTLLGQKVRDIVGETGRTSASVSGLKFNALVDLRRRLDEEGFMDECGELFGLAGEAASRG